MRQLTTAGDETAHINLALADLFANEKDPILLIKHRDILFSLEESANKCKHVTDVIEIIVLNSL